jgi:hypothetical protein
MSAVGVFSHRGTRTTGLVFAAGLVAFEIVLGLSAGAIGIPGVFVVPLHGRHAGPGAPGGESVAMKRSDQPAPVVPSRAIPVPGPAPAAATLASKVGAASNPATALPEKAAAATPVATATMTSPAAGGADDAAGTKTSAQPGATKQASTAPTAPAPEKTANTQATTPEAAQTQSADTTNRATEQTARATPAHGPVGWVGPTTVTPDADASDATAAAQGSGNNAPVSLSGPIDLNVKAAVKDINPPPSDQQAKDAQAGDGAAPSTPGDAATADANNATGSAPAEQTASDDDGKPMEILPWAAAEPDPKLIAPLPETPATKPTQTASADAGPQPAVISLPAADAVEHWLKTKALAPETGGGQAQPLKRFALWLDMPAEVKQRVVAVNYDFDSPSADPHSEESRDGQTGFRVEFGGTACAERIMLTLKFDDGQTQRVAVNGCRMSS